MKTLKTTIALFLSLLLAFGLTVSAFAAGDGIVLSGTAGDGVTWQLTDDGVLTVSGRGPIVDHKEVDYEDDGSYSVTEFESIGTLIYDGAAAAHGQHAVVCQLPRDAVARRAGEDNPVPGGKGRSRRAEGKQKRKKQCKRCFQGFHFFAPLFILFIY